MTTERLRERWRAFREWQRRPHQVEPMTDEEHVCATCQTRYTGNYCPRCGQSYKVGRYTLKGAMLMFLDVWGLGNRGMFRTLRDLLLRPGYMIRDYQQGMRMAYFPPFKMFFLLITLSLLVDSGMNFGGVNRIKEGEREYKEGLQQATTKSKQATVVADGLQPVATDEAKGLAADTATDGVKAQDGPQASDEEQVAAAEKAAQDEKVERVKQRFSQKVDQMTQQAFTWVYQHFTLVQLVVLLFLSGPLYLMFRHCPALPDLGFTEFFVSMVYINNMLTIFSILSSLLCLSQTVEMFIYLLTIFPLKQFSGYSYWKTGLRLVAGHLMFLVMAALFFFIVGVVGATAAFIYGVSETA